MIAPVVPIIEATPAKSSEAPTSRVALTLIEQEQLHVRVIALENLVIALLATATDQQLECARDMAAYIAPRPGATPHPLTLHASSQMLSMIDRATHLPATRDVDA